MNEFNDIYNIEDVNDIIHIKLPRQFKKNSISLSLNSINYDVFSEIMKNPHHYKKSYGYRDDSFHRFSTILTGKDNYNNYFTFNELNLNRECRSLYFDKRKCNHRYRELTKRECGGCNYFIDHWRCHHHQIGIILEILYNKVIVSHSYRYISI